MKVKGYRIQIMRALAWENAYAEPDGYIPMEFRITHGLKFIGAEMFGALMAQGLIEKTKPPTKALRDKFIFVWQITDKGLDWLERAEKSGIPQRTPKERHDQ